MRNCKVENAKWKIRCRGPEARGRTSDVGRETKMGVGGKGSEVGCQGSGDYQIEFHERIFHARGKLNKK